MIMNKTRVVITARVIGQRPDGRTVKRRQIIMIAGRVVPKMFLLCKNLQTLLLTLKLKTHVNAIPDIILYLCRNEIWQWVCIKWKQKLAWHYLKIAIIFRRNLLSTFAISDPILHLTFRFIMQLSSPPPVIILDFIYIFMDKITQGRDDPLPLQKGNRCVGNEKMAGKF